MYDGATVVPSSCYGMMAEMKRRKFGQVCERSTINSILSDDFSATGSCNFWMTQNDFATVTLAMAFQKKSPYIGEVNSKLQLMNQMGFLKTWIGASMPNASKCRTASDVGASHINKKEVSLSLAETEGLFIVGLMGCVLATLGLISEFTFFGSVKVYLECIILLTHEHVRFPSDKALDPERTLQVVQHGPCRRDPPADRQRRRGQDASEHPRGEQHEEDQLAYI